MVVSDGVSGPSVSSRTRSKKRAATVQEEKLQSASYEQAAVAWDTDSDSEGEDEEADLAV